jgi:hypothetical protein
LFSTSDDLGDKPVQFSSRARALSLSLSPSLSLSLPFAWLEANRCVDVQAALLLEDDSDSLQSLIFSFAYMNDGTKY